jgi:hypothetical protein
MIDNSIVKRLAEQLGFDALDVPILSVFATAIAKQAVDDYKAKLRPVTVNSSYAGIELKLYALPKETK